MVKYERCDEGHERSIGRHSHGQLDKFSAVSGGPLAGTDVGQLAVVDGSGASSDSQTCVIYVLAEPVVGHPGDADSEACVFKVFPRHAGADDIGMFGKGDGVHVEVHGKWIRIGPIVAGDIHYCSLPRQEEVTDVLVIGGVELGLALGTLRPGPPWSRHRCLAACHVRAEGCNKQCDGMPEIRHLHCCRPCRFWIRKALWWCREVVRRSIGPFDNKWKIDGVSSDDDVGATEHVVAPGIIKLIYGFDELEINYCMGCERWGRRVHFIEKGYRRKREIMEPRELLRSLVAQHISLGVLPLPVEPPSRKFL